RKTEALARLNQELEQRVEARTGEIQASNVALRESEERLRLVLLAGGIQGWNWDLQKNELAWVKPADDSHCGTEPAEDFLARVHSSDRQTIQHAVQRALEGLRDFYAEFRTLQDG